MCYVQNCSNGNVLGSYFIAGACTAHYQAIKTDLANVYAGLKADADLCNNVALAYALMSDEDAVLKLLDDLASWLGGVDPKRVRLSAALEYHELLCWFPRVRIMPTGLLSSPEFLKLIAHGCMLKDVGAGAPHGRLTHRLQWYALMAAMTKKFTVPFAAPWTISPLKLYCALGDAALTQGNHSAWGTVFDLAGSDPERKFRAPDRLHAALLKSSKLALQVNLSRKRDDDARNLAWALLKHLREADHGKGPLAGWVQKEQAAPLILACQKSFGLGRAFTYEELYEFIDQSIYKQSKTQTYDNALLYIIGQGTPAATQRYLEKRKLPMNLPVVDKPGLTSPDDTAIANRITASLTSLNSTEVKSIDWGGFEKKSA